MITRRELLKAGAAAGALLLGGGGRSLAHALGPFSTDRRSRLFPEDGTSLVHADLHNHSLLSDGAGAPEEAFASMRAAGLDVAALTDHSTLSFGALSVAGQFVDVCQGDTDCRSVACIDEERWAQAGELADAADDPGSFTALRGFEWSSPFLGHMNVWFSERWIDPLHTGGIGPEGLGEHFHENVPGAGELLGPVIDDVLRANPAKGPGMAAFYEWLQAAPSTPVLGGGADGLAGFNHPGREQGRFGYFRYEPALADRIVSMEILNRRDDYLFRDHADAQPSPLLECLDAGWRVGLLGVTDEHGTDWGFPDGKGRAGLWVRTLDRAGVREAMEARRFYATNLRGLRLDAAIDGVRMGQTLAHRTGDVTVQLDLDRGDEWPPDLPLRVQVLRTGTDGVPSVSHEQDIRPGLSTFRMPLDVEDGRWLVLRIADPADSTNEPGPAGHPANLRAVAYASPFWLDPDAA